MAGVHLSLHGVVIANNSYVISDRIGNNDTGALLCQTDKTDCCNSSLSPNGTELGNWYSPDGSLIEDLNSGSGMPVDSIKPNSFLVNRGGSVVRLLRPQSVSSSELGRFCCELSDAEGAIQRVYVIICKSDENLMI